MTTTPSPRFAVPQAPRIREPPHTDQPMSLHPDVQNVVGEVSTESSVDEALTVAPPGQCLRLPLTWLSMATMLMIANQFLLAYPLVARPPSDRAHLPHSCLGP